MAEKIKQEITPETLLKTCWLNGYSIAALARKFKRSSSLIHRAVEEPDQYPKFYARLCAALPKRLEDEKQEA